MRGAGGTGSELGFRLSPKIKKAKMRFSPQMAAAVQPGPVTPNQPTLSAPSTGPKMNPNPNAMPMSPIRLERSSGSETSAMYALATERFAPQTPAAIREASSSQMEPAPQAKANTVYEIQAPVVLMSNTGRRPMRSDSRPHIGAKMNCISEYEATMQPAIRPDAPNSLLYQGNIGSTMPNPTKSMKTVRKITSNEAFRAMRKAQET